MNRLTKLLIPAIIITVPAIASAGLFDDLKAVGNKLNDVAKGLQEGTTSAPETDADTSSSESSGSINNAAPSSGVSSNNGAAGIAQSNSTIEFICKPLQKKSIYQKLAKPDMKMVTTDFGKSEAELGLMLSRQPDAELPYLVNLSQYKDGFDSEEVTELFGNFLKNPNTRDLAIMAATSKVSSFDKKKKKMSNDAIFAYALVHLFYKNHGGDAALGDKLLLDAAKKNQYGARFIEGIRWARGYDRAINLSSAVNWMKPSYELSAERDGDLAQIIENEFMGIVLNPAYSNYQLYADLAQAAEEQRRSMEQQIQQNAGNLSNAALFRSEIRDLTITRGQLLIELSEVTNAGVDLERYKAVFAELSNQTNPSIQTVSELIVVTDDLQNRLTTQLASINEMEASTIPKIEALFVRTENYVSTAHSTALGYGVTLMMSGNVDFLNQETFKLVSEIGRMRPNACSIRQGILDFATRTNVELKPTDAPVGTNILAPRKKKER